MQWSDLPHDALAARQLYAVLRLRSEVFVVEQECAYQDIDGRDLAGGTRHLLATDDAGLAGYARLLAPEDDEHGHAHIGRVVTASRSRGTGLGRELMRRGIEACAHHWPEAPIALAAQAHLERFYAGFGFATVSEPYDWDGIDHVDMLRGDSRRPA